VVIVVLDFQYLAHLLLIFESQEVFVLRLYVASNPITRSKSTGKLFQMDKYSGEVILA
jgi:hypothetical protein